MKEKIEIKIQSKGERYFELIKNKIIKPLMIILTLIGVLYIGFYVLLFVIIFAGISYLINSFKK
tara:strand:- start:165 stop:356 length:192 start_codon:yes stop_codon:yes gene_type:complete